MSGGERLTVGSVIPATGKPIEDGPDIAKRWRAGEFTANEYLDQKIAGQKAAEDARKLANHDAILDALRALTNTAASVLNGGGYIDDLRGPIEAASAAIAKAEGR